MNAKKYLLTKKDGGQIIVKAYSLGHACEIARAFITFESEIVSGAVYTGTEPEINLYFMTAP